MITRDSQRIVFAGYGLVTACSAANADSVRPLADGRYELECKNSLRECLAHAEAGCGSSGYQVLGATEVRRRVGVPPVESDYTESRALFMCGGDAKLDTHVATPSAPTESAPISNTCLPGASNACAGPGGCSGGQVCLADGRSLGTCDCGAPTSLQPR
jgi:hypothetical protein